MGPPVVTLAWHEWTEVEEAPTGAPSWANWGLRSGIKAYFEERTGAVEIVRDGRLEVVYFQYAEATRSYAKDFFQLPTWKNQIFRYSVPAKELALRLEDFMESAHGLIFSIKNTLHLVDTFDKKKVHGAQGVTSRRAWLSYLFTRLGPALDVNLQLVLIAINLLNLLFYDPDLEEQVALDNSTTPAWFVPGGMHAENPPQFYACTGAPGFFDEECLLAAWLMHPLGVFQSCFLGFWLAIVYMQMLPPTLYTQRLNRLRQGKKVSDIEHSEAPDDRPRDSPHDGKSAGAGAQGLSNRSWDLIGEDMPRYHALREWTYWDMMRYRKRYLFFTLTILASSLLGNFVHPGGHAAMQPCSHAAMQPDET